MPLQVASTETQQSPPPKQSLPTRAFGEWTGGPNASRARGAEGRTKNWRGAGHNRESSDEGRGERLGRFGRTMVQQREVVEISAFFMDTKRA